MFASGIQYNQLRLKIDSTYECISQMKWGLDYFKKKISEDSNANKTTAYQKANESADIQTEPDVHFSIFNSIAEALNEPLWTLESDFEYLFCNAMYIMSFSYFENSLRKILKDKLTNYNYKWSIDILINKVESLSMIRPTFDYETLHLIRNQLCHNNLGTTNKKHQAKMELYIKAHTKEFSWIDEILVINDIDYCNNTLNEYYKYLCDVCDVLGYKHSET